ncbi:hypothetical protein GUY61_31365 [Streptomyces sp. GC420]|nr:hypothetical protein [Streptomyces sp. GC420]
MGFGAVLLSGLRDPLSVLVWLAGGIVLHDAVLAPLVLGAGLLLASLPARRTVRGALIVACSLTLVALPPLLRPGRRGNASVLPLDYPRNWLLALTAVAVVTAGLVLARRPGRRRPGRRAPIGPPVERGADRTG